MSNLINSNDEWAIASTPTPAKRFYGEVQSDINRRVQAGMDLAEQIEDGRKKQSQRETRLRLAWEQGSPVFGGRDREVQVLPQGPPVGSADRRARGEVVTWR